MKAKKIELVLRKEKDGFTGWSLYTIDGRWIEYFCRCEIQKLFNPGDETCMILEITAHPAEWVGGSL